MLALFFLGLVSTILHSIEQEKLIQSSTGETYYSVIYENGWEKFAINLNCENPSNGSISNISNSGLKNLNVSIENNSISNAVFNGGEKLHPSMSQPFLDLYISIKKEFELKQKNNNLPPLQQ